MADLLYYIVEKMAGIHDVLMTLNDSYETMFSDKELHFIVIGVLGMALLFVIFPLFKALSRHHVLVIAWIYVFTLIIVITFAIEIGQQVTHTGHHEYREYGNGRYRKRSGWIYVPVYHICGAEGDCSWHCTSGQRYYGPG